MILVSIICYIILALSLIVPFRISHLADVFEANKGFKIVPRQVDIYFGEPIETSEMSKKDQRFLADHMKEIVQSLH